MEVLFRSGMNGLSKKDVHTAERFLRSGISFPAGETAKNFSYDLLRCGFIFACKRRSCYE